MTEKRIEWMATLFGEYPTRNKDGREIRTHWQLENLKKSYADYDLAVMDDAVQRYMRVGRFFPSVADLWPHVQAAQEAARGTPFDDDFVPYRRGMGPEEIARFDAMLFEFEEARGWKS